jgi:molybdenum cofactor cytidylyltransferase
MNVAAIVLSAGASLRMGQPKALMNMKGKTFLQQIIDVLSATKISEIHIVLGSSAEQIRATLVQFRGKIIYNAHWQEGQLSSIIVAINSLDVHSVDAMMLCLVDHPLIAEKTVNELLFSFAMSRKKIIVPTYCGQRGHPVIFSRDLFSEIKNALAKNGARSVLQKFPNEICEVPTTDAGIVANIDTIQDYERYIFTKEND